MNTRLSIADARRVSGKRKPALPHIGFDQIRKSWFKDRNFAAIECRHPVLVLIDASHLVAEVGKAGAGNETNITGADHGYAHKIFLTLLAQCGGFTV
jgi:hypothetical protein